MQSIGPPTLVPIPLSNKVDPTAVDDPSSSHGYHKALFKHQRGKCAFCEVPLLAVRAGVVHSLKARRGIRKSPEVRGYRSLLLLCAQCARNARALPKDAHLINPAEEDPRGALAYHSECAYGVTPRGKETVERLQLNHPGLCHQRREHLLLLRWVAYCRDMLAARYPAASAREEDEDLVLLQEEAAELLERAQHPEAAYSLMASTALAL